jgi:regulatory protein
LPFLVACHLPLAFITCHEYSSLVRSSPRKFSTEAGLYNAATRALMRRAHSVHEMKEYLSLRAEDKDHAEAVLQKLKELNYLDDARYARDFARAHAQNRHQGKFRIARELRARGVPDRHIETALESAFAETDESALVKSRIERHLRRFRGSAHTDKLARSDEPSGRGGRLGGSARSGGFLDEKKLASLYRSLLRAGFSADVIRTQLRSASREALPESEALPDSES